VIIGHKYCGRGAGRLLPGYLSKRREVLLSSQDYSTQLVELLKQEFGESIRSTKVVLGETIVTLDKSCKPDFLKMCRFLHDQPATGFNYLSFVTAIDYLRYKPQPEHGCRYELIYQLFSVETGRHMRLKLPLAPGHKGALSVPSVTPVWRSAELQEDEVYDMFGIKFEGHPDLRRIYMPEDWRGHPLRKDYRLKDRGKYA